MTNLEYISLLDEEEMSELFDMIYHTGVVDALANEIGDNFVWTPGWFEKKYGSRRFWKEDLIEQ